MIKQRICKAHYQEYIAIDLNPKCDAAKRHFCFKCLKDQNQALTSTIFQYPEAHNYFLNVKKQFQNQKNNQNQQNLGILDSLLRSVIEIKEQKIIALDQLQQYLEQQKQALELHMSELEADLTQLDIDQYLSIRHEFNQSKINLEQLQSDFLTHVTLIQAEIPIDQLRKTIQTIDKQQIKLIPTEQIQVNGIEQIVVIFHLNKKLSFQCPLHSKDIDFFDFNKQTQGLACEDCVSQKTGPFTKLTEAYKLWEDYQFRQKKSLITQLENSQLRVKAQQLELQELLSQYKNNIDLTSNTLNKKFQVHQQKILSMMNSKLFIEWPRLNIEEIRDVISTMSNSDLFATNVQIQNQDLQSYLQHLHQKVLVEKGNLQFLNQNENQPIQHSKISEQLQESENSKSKRERKIKEQKIIDLRITNLINYRLVKQNQIQQNQSCSALAFSKDQMILVAGCEGSILIYEFFDGQLKLQQQYDKLTKAVTCLYFMKNKFQFVVGCYDDQMQIWSLNAKKLWFCEQILHANQNQINSIAVNQNECLIISGSQDGFIKFWTKSQDWMCQQTIKDADCEILCLSLNESSTILAACGYQNERKWLKKNEGFIAIYQDNEHQIWQQIQIIKQQLTINKLCFIGEEMLVYQNSRCGVMNILRQMQGKNSFQQVGEVKLEGDTQVDSSIFFPLIYNRSKSILLVKHDKKLTLIKFEKRKGQFLICQSMQFETQVLEGAITNDGDYIITWDNIDQTFLVREQY